MSPQDTRQPAVTTFTIDRAKHARGLPTALLLGSHYVDALVGKSCCLGFYCRAHGYTDADMRNVGLPCNLYDEGRLLPKWAQSLIPVRVVLEDTRSKLVAANDCNIGDDRALEMGILTEADRERVITEIFAEQGVTVLWDGVL